MRLIKTQLAYEYSVRMGMAVDYVEIEFKRLIQENPLRQYIVLSDVVKKAAATIKVNELELKRLIMHRQLELN